MQSLKQATIKEIITILPKEVTIEEETSTSTMFKALKLKFESGTFLAFAAGSSYSEFVISILKPKEFKTKFRLSATVDDCKLEKEFDSQEEAETYVQDKKETLPLTDIAITPFQVEV